MTVTKLLAGIAALVGVTAGVTMGAGSDDSGNGHQLVGIFKDASPLEPGQDVRLQGVRVGTIKDIKLEDGKAHVSMNMDLDSLPLHQDARMTLKPVNLLGEFYVDISPGTDSKPMLENGVVPASQTSSIVTIQQVLDTLDDPTAAALAAMIAGLGEGLDDAGGDTSDALKALAPAMQDASDLGQILSDQNQVLSQLVSRTQPVAGAVAQRDGDVLDQLVDTTEKTLTAVADEQSAADETLAELPSTLITARRTLNRLAGASDATTPTLKSLRPVTDDLNQLTSELYDFADSADPALASLQPVLDEADALIDQAAPVAAELRSAGPDFATATGKLRPLGEQLLDQHLQDLMDFVRKWSLSTNGKDALSHYFRGVFHVTPNTLKDLALSMGVVKPNTPSEGSNGGDPLGSVPGVTDDLGLGGIETSPKLPVPNAVTDRNSATGLSQSQEQSLIGDLLGGE